jgi:hypothetical protein
MNILERATSIFYLPQQLKLQQEAYQAYQASRELSSRETSDSILLARPDFYEHKKNTPIMMTIGIWQHLSEAPWEVWQQSGGKQAISVLFALVNDYDDFVDRIENRTCYSTEQEIRNAWRTEKAGEDRPLFKEMVADLIWSIDQMDISAKERFYILRKIISFRKVFLEETFHYEYESQDFSLEKACLLRENTCRPYGEASAAVLNGRECLTEKGLSVERTIGNWFVAIQVVEDLLDINEDIEMGNLSFFTGALKDHPEEERQVFHLLKTHPQPNRKDFQRCAPESFQDVEKVFHHYLDWFVSDEKDRFLRAYLSNAFYILYPLKDMLKL